MTRVSSDEVQSVLDRIRREELLQLTLDLGNIYSPTGEEGPACDFAYTWMLRNGLAPERIGASEERYNVLGRIPGTGGGLSLIFNSHLDTIVSRTDTWMYLNPEDPAFHAAWLDDEDRVWGLPVINCKGPMACWMIAAKAIRESGIQLRGDILLSSVVGEIDCEPVDEFQGYQYLAQDIGTRYLINHGALADFALVAEATNFRLGSVEAGRLYFKLTVQAGPSRYTPYVSHPPPETSANAIVQMVAVIEAFERWADSYQRRYTREYPGGTMVPKSSIGAIRGGMPRKIHRQPELCSIYVDIRLNPDTPPLQIQDEVRQVMNQTGVSVEIKPYLYRRGFQAQGAEPLAEVIIDSHRAILGEIPGPCDSPEISMWRDTNPFNEMGIPSLTYGPGGGAGGGNLFFALDDMVNAARIYALTALRLCNTAKQPAAEFIW